MTPTARFLRARQALLDHRDDLEAARQAFSWPDLPEFNWALDWFDVLAEGNDRPALSLWSDEAEVERLSFRELSERSSRLASFLRGHGVGRGDPILVMLPNVTALWEVMLAAIKLGAVVVPSTPLLTPRDLGQRLDRGGIKHLVTDAAGVEKLGEVDLGGRTRFLAGRGIEAIEGWTSLAGAASASARFTPEGPTKKDDPFLLYFTSGTTAQPKLVLHTHQSYPVGHLSTMYWLGLREGDVHENISSPGWAKHAWSSFFAPWNAGATILVHAAPRFSAARSIDVLRRAKVNTLCAPPTVWRMMIVGELGARPADLRELCSAGEPLNPEVIEQVRAAWGLTIRDGYGQTETTAQIGNSPGQEVRVGSMGKPLPGYRVALVDAAGNEGHEGEIALRLDPAPLSLMVGYRDDEARTAEVMAGGFYRTGDEASRDGDGYYHFVGRGDDVFKSSDYRISPFELESVLLEHPAVAEAAVVPSPDPLRLSVPKAFVSLVPERSPGKDLAHDILAFCRTRLPPYARIRRIEFAELPKTISGKIRRVELRARERERLANAQAEQPAHAYDDHEGQGPAGAPR